MVADRGTDWPKLPVRLQNKGVIQHGIQARLWDYATAYTSEIGGVNTTVATIQAELELWVGELQSSQLAAKAQVVKLRAALCRNRVRLELALGSSFDGMPATAVR